MIRIVMGIEWLFLARVVRTEMGFVSASRQPMSIIKLDEIAHTIYQPSSIILRSLSSESGRYHSDEPRCTRIGTRTIYGKVPGPASAFAIHNLTRCLHVIFQGLTIGDAGNAQRRTVRHSMQNGIAITKVIDSLREVEARDVLVLTIEVLKPLRPSPTRLSHGQTRKKPLLNDKFETTRLRCKFNAIWQSEACHIT